MRRLVRRTKSILLVNLDVTVLNSGIQRRRSCTRGKALRILLDRVPKAVRGVGRGWGRLGAPLCTSDRRTFERERRKGTSSSTDRSLKTASGGSRVVGVRVAAPSLYNGQVCFGTKKCSDCESAQAVPGRIACKKMSVQNLLSDITCFVCQAVWRPEQLSHVTLLVHQ